jgi:CheY-like chemotaxis protein
VFALRPDLAPVKADGGQVEQIIVNLVVNARDAMPRGGTLMIETANIELDDEYAKTRIDAKVGSYVVLRISDTGTGIPPDVKTRMFEPFFTTKEPGKGTGLGLATVHGIATQNGGLVDVESELGKGTTFSVYFPRAEASAVVSNTPASVVHPDLGIRTVLVVDDDDALRRLTERLLTRQGFKVLLAANASEAVDVVATNPSIDVVLTDVVMPGASGPELTQQLVGDHPTLKVIYMSGYTEDAIVHHGVLRPGIAFLNKPFTSQTLVEKIREVLAAR